MTKYKRGEIKGTNTIMIAHKTNGSMQIEVTFQNATTLERTGNELLNLENKDGKLTFKTQYGEFYI